MHDPQQRRPDGRRTAGFTLLELLVVVAIIAVLAAYVGPRYFGQVARSEQAAAQAQVESLHRALVAYRLDMGAFPSTSQGLAALIRDPGAAAPGATWRGPYLGKSLPSDPWGRPYAYRSPVPGADYELLSLGKDGLPGGTGDAADIGGAFRP